MIDIWKALTQFHTAFSLPVSNKPKLPKLNHEDEEFMRSVRTIMKSCEHASELPSTSTRALRIKLLLEEFAEYLDGELNHDLVEIADALTDIHYIAAGTEVVYGIPGSDVFSHVHDTNMAKLGPNGKPIYRNDGKVMKPEGWQAPNIEKFLKT